MSTTMLNLSYNKSQCNQQESAMTTLPEIQQRAIALIQQLPTEKLTAITQLLEILAETYPSSTNAEELTLLDTIQRQLPLAQHDRLVELRDRCEWGELTEAEHQELIGYEDWLEQRNVDRLEALIKLANLRNVDLVSLNRQLKSEAQVVHVP
jgi:hypothetical protein